MGGRGRPRRKIRERLQQTLRQEKQLKSCPTSLHPRAIQIKSTVRYQNPALRVVAMNIVTLRRTEKDKAAGTHSLWAAKWDNHSGERMCNYSHIKYTLTTLPSFPTLSYLLERNEKVCS